ncbi:MAG: hypothetical protein A2Y15_09560 [Clostridiales bacterium GWF2_36_10]|nr:MAG: hypothetical protein A2Y15_09560 [Clostridiales bacterium GWF2_36_10]HAN21565.1 hypothetical protein [Clostridiales bacterium]
MENFLDLAEIKYFNSENAKIYRTKSGFAAMKAFMPPIKKDDLSEENHDNTPDWQDLGRVYFHRMFPFDSPDEFISVLDKDGKEYGVIRNLIDFSGEDAEIISETLYRKYLCPEITKILSLKERLGYSYWEVETDKGRMNFSMHDTFRNIARVSDTRLVLSDVDGNRFSVKDTLALDRKSYRKIELYL